MSFDKNIIFSDFRLNNRTCFRARKRIHPSFIINIILPLYDSNKHYTVELKSTEKQKHGIMYFHYGTNVSIGHYNFFFINKKFHLS